MAIQRASILYPVNSTTVDTGGGGSGDIRLLASSQAGTAPNQTCTATHTQDGQNRTFDPANFGVTANTNPGLIQHRGWALRLSDDMTPTDDTNCNAYLPAGTGTVEISVTINQSGGTYASGTYAPLWAYGLFKYNPSTDAATLITFGNNNATSWTIVLGDLGTFKTISMPLVIPAGVEFAAGEILLLQIGLGLQTIPNPTLGTATWTYTLRVDSSATRVVWGTAEGIRQTCVVTNSVTGSGEATRALATAQSRSVTGTGVSTIQKSGAVSKTSDNVSAGTVTNTKAVTKTATCIGAGVPTASLANVVSKTASTESIGIVTRQLNAGVIKSASGDGVVTTTKVNLASKIFSLIGDATVTEAHPVQTYRTFNIVSDAVVLMSRSVITDKNFDLLADGDITKRLSTSITRSADADGIVTNSGVNLTSKTFDVTGAAIISETHPVQAFRTFNLAGEGIISGRIEIPIDEVPTGGGGDTFIRSLFVFDD